MIDLSTRDSRLVVLARGFRCRLYIIIRYWAIPFSSQLGTQLPSLVILADLELQLAGNEAECCKYVQVMAPQRGFIQNSSELSDYILIIEGYRRKFRSQASDNMDR